MVRHALRKWGIGSFSVLLALLCGCNEPEAKFPRAITSAEQTQITQDPLAAMYQARSQGDGAIFFEAGKELISSKKIYDMTVKELSENIGKAYMRNWEASNIFGLPTGRTAWLFGAGKARFFVAARGEDRRIKKARVYWMAAKGDEVITQYPPEDESRRERETMAAIILLYYLTAPSLDDMPDMGK
ncbi:MAG: hypothetical protein KAV00_09090 [Phycisphaerae bacterium]|nr:hypothetical protein [Phycisphaerae bacterium]